MIKPVKNFFRVDPRNYPRRRSASTHKSFTLIEILTVVGILLVLTAIAVPAYHYFQAESELSNTTEEVITILRLAQNKTLASEGASQWGVFFNNSASPHQFVLFKGANYLSRDPAFDEAHRLPTSVEIYEINLGGGNEIIFKRLIGETAQTGNIVLRLKTDSKTKTVYIEQSGKVGLVFPVIPSDQNRVKDSRHLHFYYNRLIDTNIEKITLTFEGGATEEIQISANLKEGQIFWEGEVGEAGATQKLKIHTHRLNDPITWRGATISYTQFSIHRDRRYNNKTLIITISGDTSGSLVGYSADGLTTTSASIYITPSVSNLNWQ